MPPRAVVPTMMRPWLAARAAAFVREGGLGCPASGWVHDRHWRLALWAALPVWAGLLMLAGPHLRAPSDPQAWLSLVITQPVLEELTIRGLVQGLFLGWFGARACTWRSASLSVANLLATALFVALHLSHQHWAWALAVAAPSLLLGHLRERMDSVWPCVILHAWYNLGFAGAAWSARLLA